MKRMVCGYCGCEFEFDYRDLLEHETSVKILYSVDCPYCSMEHPLPSDIINQLREFGISNQLKAENPRKDFEEDVRALAEQYGLTVKSVEVE